MSSSSVARSQRILDKLAEREGLTEPAKQWLTVALDPFHDNPTNCTGIPDSQTGDSVVQCIKSSVTIDCPPGITTGTWDCHVVMAPFFANTAQPLNFVSGFSASNSYEAIRFDNTQISRSTAPVTIVAYPTGDSTAYANPFAGDNPSDSVHATTLLNLNGNYTAGDYRVVSQGFEVINTTAVLNQQGLCTVYRSPVPSLEMATSKATVCLSDGTPSPEVKTWGEVMYLPLDNIPLNPQQALTLPGTKQWHAKEGCYVTGKINQADVDVSNNLWTQPLFDRYGTDSGLDVAYYFPALGFSTFGSTTPVNVPSTRPIQWTPMDISGSFFTGLSLTSTLTINWNIYIERFPSILETDLVVIAKPSPLFCPMAFEVYKAVAQNLPVGVMQKENGLGDWFRDAVGTVAEFVQPVAALIPHPAAQAVSTAAGVAKKLLRQENESPYIGSAKAEREYLQPVAAKPKKAKKQKKEIKKEIKKEVMLKPKKAKKK